MAEVADASDRAADSSVRPHLVLASGSPRRHELLTRLGVPFSVRVPDIDEAPRRNEDPATYVERLARAKAVAAATTVTSAGARGSSPAEIVLAADTTVALADVIMGKPADAAEASVMLRALSGRTHQVHTAVAVIGERGLVSSVTTTEVTFRRLGADEIAGYVATGDPLDKAGAYGIQGEAGCFVSAIAGSASNVVGLPMAQTAALLAAAGLDTVVWGPPRPPNP